MNPHTLNGERLLAQNRHKEAAEAFGKALAEDPQDAAAFANLALAQFGSGNKRAALDAARESVQLAPNQPFAHYVLGFIYLSHGKLIDAKRAASQALQMRPDHAEYYRLLALVKAEESHYEEALRLVEAGLQQDPEDTDCLNLRSQLLLKLNRRVEAAQTTGAALASAPDDTQSHANAGWTALHNNKTKDALGHFKESLRLEPGNDWAKAGLAEALKARNPIYRPLLMFFMWMNRLDGRTQFFLILGGWLAMRAMRTVSEEMPGTRPFLMPLIVLYFVFVAMTWVGQPFFDLTLMLSPYGRNALSSLQRNSAALFGGLVTVGLVCCGLAVAGLDPTLYAWAIIAGVLAVTLSRTVAEPVVWRKRAMATLSGLILLGGATAIIALYHFGQANPITTLGAATAGLSFFAFMWLPLVKSFK